MGFHLYDIIYLYYFSNFDGKILFHISYLVLNMSTLYAVIININDVVEISVTTIEIYLVQLALDSCNVSDGHLACQAIIIGNAHCNRMDLMLIALSSMETLM